MKKLPLIALFAAVAFAASVAAQGTDTGSEQLRLPPPIPKGHIWQNPPLTDATTQAFEEIQPLIDRKAWDDAMAVLNKAEAAAAPESYDLAIILDTKAKLYLQGKADYARAIAEWEKAFQLGQSHTNYFRRRDTAQTLIGLAELHYELVAGLKDKAAQRYHLGRALHYIRWWMQAAPRPTAEGVQFYSTLEYYAAVADPAHIDRAELGHAKSLAKLGLSLSVKPNASYYQMLVAIAQEEGDFTSAAEYLELMESLPGDAAVKRGYWPDLVACYNALAGATEQEPWLQRIYYARAINAIERAQALGYMKAPRDNYNLVTLYFAAGQTGTAADLLSAGLHSGAIESTLQNWQALSYFYQDEDRSADAVSALKEAADRFPGHGEIDYTISQIYDGMDRTAEAFEYAGRALAAGNLRRHLFGAYELYAYLGYELKRYPQALAAIDSAEKLPEAKQSANNLSSLRDAIAQAMRLETEQRSAAGLAAGDPPAP